MSHGKKYRNENDEFHRRTVWAKNKAFVEEHNKNSQKHGFIVELNKFADLVSTCMLNCCHECCSLHQNHVVRKMESSLESTMGTVKKHLAHKSKTKSCISQVIYRLLCLQTGGQKVLLLHLKTRSRLHNHPFSHSLISLSVLGILVFFLSSLFFIHPFFIPQDCLFLNHTFNYTQQLPNAHGIELHRFIPLFYVLFIG